MPVTLRLLLSDHLNLYLPIQNHHIHNHLVDSTQIHGSPQNNSKLSYLHTPIYTHTQNHTHRSYTILLSCPNISTHWILVILATWWNSTTSYEDQRSVALVISESQFTFLMEVCFDLIIYFSMIYVTICYFLSINSQLIFTPSLRMD